MPRPKKYATEEARKAARRETKRKSQAKYRETHERPSRAKFAAWEPKFIGLDGESFVTSEKLPDRKLKQSYNLLLRSDKDPIYSEKGLSTWECLKYLTDDFPQKTAVVGYFLNFDFEWILKDLKQKEYKALQRGEVVELFGGEFRVQWFVGKKLVVHVLKHQARRKVPELRDEKDYRMTSFQDVQGFFQSSFVSALKKWGFKDDPRLKIITSGKAARGGFKWKDFDKVSEYNAMEMELLEELMHKVYDSFKSAYETAGLKFRVNSLTWSGPGVFANDFLKQTLWNEQHPKASDELVRKYRADKLIDFGNKHAQDFPFSLAYFGGRIELAGAGRFGAGYNYDINSAYPYAVSLLPSWNEQDFAVYGYQGRALDEAKPFLDRRLMGMYQVRFTFPEGWTWYPFPVRMTDGGSPNVFYPRRGVTYVMSSELFAVLDTLPPEELENVYILDAIVLETTDGYGDALNRMPEDLLCKTAREVSKMAVVRLDCKAAGKRLGTPEELEGDNILATAEKALKLILNSLYGKTVQQIGSHKYYNDFASAWITSVCRALLWRAIAPERASEHVLMTMTDGVYSLVPLSFAADRLSSVLGEWEETHFESMETFKPGIYRYEHDGEMDYKVRGFLTPTIEDKEKLFDLIHTAQTEGKVKKFPAKQFLTRNVALHGWKREPWLRQFYTDKKDIKAELNAKREPLDSGWVFPTGQVNAFFPPKRSNMLNHSVGYALDFEGVLEPTEETIEEFMMEYDAKIGLEELYE